MTTQRRKSNKRRTMKAGAGKLPTSEVAAIKRAKKAIQKLGLNTDSKKTDKLIDTAKEEVANADARAGDRKNWRSEVLIKSNKEFSDSVMSSRWYVSVNSTKKWDLSKDGAPMMPAWASNGKDEPDSTDIIEGKPYKK